MDSEAAPVGRTAANGSRTGPNTFTTPPSGRFRLSRTSAPREMHGAEPATDRDIVVVVDDHLRSDLVGDSGPTHAAAVVSCISSGIRTAPRLLVCGTLKDRPSAASNEYRGDVPRRQPEPGP